MGTSYLAPVGQGFLLPFVTCGSFQAPNMLRVVHFAPPPHSCLVLIVRFNPVTAGLGESYGYQGFLLPLGHMGPSRPPMCHMWSCLTLQLFGLTCWLLPCDSWVYLLHLPRVSYFPFGLVWPLWALVSTTATYQGCIFGCLSPAA